jgi:carbamoyltransferase
MKILGITNGYTSGACIIVNNKLKASVSEERFSRKKQDNSWPEKSIEYVLKSQNLTLNTINKIVYGLTKGFDFEKDLLFYFDRICREAFLNKKNLNIFRNRIEQDILRDKFKRQQFLDFIKNNKLKDKSEILRHHDCHAFSVFCLSKFKKSLVVTADGRGDFESITVSQISDKGLNKIYRSTSNDSLGYFYSRIAKLLGFTPHKHEGKVTGLAARGNPRLLIKKMEKMIYFEKGNIYANNGEFYKPFFEDGNNKLAWSKIALKYFKNFDKSDIAAAAQKHLENLLIKLISYYLTKTKENNLCVSGGVFANVLANQKIREIKKVKNFFTLPHVGDEGLAIGAAVGFNFLHNKKKTSFENLYLGPKFQMNIKELKNKYKIKITKINNLNKFMINCLKNNKIIGYFDGRMEFGPRALCHRSILYHCNDQKINIELNERLNRYEFMPFAPVTAIELAKKCYKGWDKRHFFSSYMTSTYSCTKLMKKNCPAIVHLDNTARPQILSKKDNKQIHSLLINWYKETGGLSLINTSFNAHEEPIVSSPDDAIKSFLDNTVDVLIINGFMVSRDR